MINRIRQITLTKPKPILISSQACKPESFLQYQWDNKRGLVYRALTSIHLANTTPVINRFIKINSYGRLDWKASANSDVAINIFSQTRPTVFKPRIAPHIQWNINAGKHIGFGLSFSGIYNESPVVPINKFYYSISNSIQLKF